MQLILSLFFSFLIVFTEPVYSSYIKGISNLKNCLFCKIVDKKIRSYRFWEDKNHLAFLSIYPNTPGVTVVVPKIHYPSYAFDLDDEVLKDFVIAAKRTAKILDETLLNVGRSALVFEGFGINHVHAKLFPMHGTKEISKSWEPIKSSVRTYYHSYPGYISSHDSLESSDKELTKIYKLLCKHPNSLREE